MHSIFSIFSSQSCFFRLAFTKKKYFFYQDAKKIYSFKIGEQSLYVEGMKEGVAGGIQLM